jgi:hypothetical protein
MVSQKRDEASAVPDGDAQMTTYPPVRRVQALLQYVGQHAARHTENAVTFLGEAVKVLVAAARRRRTELGFELAKRRRRGGLGDLGGTRGLVEAPRDSPGVEDSRLTDSSRVLPPTHNTDRRVCFADHYK